MNRLYKTLIYDGQVSLSVCDATEMVNDAIKIHSLSDGEAKLLGGLLTACTYMAGCLKSPRGAVSITVKSDDGSATASVSGDADGHIRGYIENAEGGLKGGTMNVVKEDGFFRPFVGVCPLISNDVAENLTEYFIKSEQIETFVAIGVEVEGGKCLAAGGVVLQCLPRTSEENSLKAKEAVNSLGDLPTLIKEVGAEGILNSLNADGQTFETFPAYKCNCSRKKIERVLLSIGKDECLKICDEQGKVSVHCHYCNTDHEFTEEQVLKLFI